MRPTIATFATDQPHYRKHARRLRGQLDACGMPGLIDPLPAWTDDKREACLYRPQWILDRLDKFGPLLWFDVDGDLLAPIDIAREDWDVASVRNPAFWRERNPQNQITAGIIGFNDTPRARDFLREWAYLCSMWRPGTFGSHRRLCQARHTVDYRELDITEKVAGRVVLRGARGRMEVAL